MIWIKSDVVFKFTTQEVSYKSVEEQITSVIFLVWVSLRVTARNTDTWVYICPSSWKHGLWVTDPLCLSWHYLLPFSIILDLCYPHRFLLLFGLALSHLFTALNLSSLLR